MNNTNSRFGFDKVEGNGSAMAAFLGGSHSGVNADGTTRAPVQKPVAKRKPQKLSSVGKRIRRELAEEAGRCGLSREDLVGL